MKTALKIMFAFRAVCTLFLSLTILFATSLHADIKFYALKTVSSDSTACIFNNNSININITTSTSKNNTNIIFEVTKSSVGILYIIVFRSGV